MKPMFILQFKFLGITLFEWLISLAILVITYFGLQLAKQVALNRIERFSERTASQWNTFALTEVSRIRTYFILALAVYLASLALPLDNGPRELIRLVAEAAMLLQIAVWGTALINFMVNDRAKSRVNFDPSTATTMNAVSLITRVILWALILLIMLENIPGIQINSLIASLGITGVAVALAVQRILGDLFASLSIALDKPFVLGDFIIIDQYQGTVENIGLKSTRLRSLEGEQLIFSNSDLLNSRIHNYKRMARRRVQFPLRISLKTPTEKLSEIPRMVEDAIGSLDGLSFERAHFRQFGPAAYEFEVVYFVESPSYSTYMDKQQAVNLRLLQCFQETGIELASA